MVLHGVRRLGPTVRYEHTHSLTALYLQGAVLLVQWVSAQVHHAGCSSCDPYGEKQISVQMIYAHSSNAIRVTSFRDSINMFLLLASVQWPQQCLFKLLTSVQVSTCDRYPVLTLWALTVFVIWTILHLSCFQGFLSACSEEQPTHDPCL